MRTVGDGHRAAEPQRQSPRGSDCWRTLVEEWCRLFGRHPLAGDGESETGAFDTPELRTYGRTVYHRSW